MANRAADAGGEIRAALQPMLRADAGVVAAFSGKRVRIYNLAPPASEQSLFPYVAIGLGELNPEHWDGVDAGEYFASVHVWSRPDPRATDEAGAIAAALAAACLTLTGASTPNFEIGEVIAMPTRLLEDPDGMSIHAVVEAQFPFDLA